MKKIYLLTFMGCLITVANAQSWVEKWVVNDNSQVRINGKSNINLFECTYEKTFRNSKISVEDSLGTLIFKQTLILFEVQFFNCHHAKMTSDFRQTMNEMSYPLLEMNIVKLYQTQEGCFLELHLTVAGQEKPQYITLNSCEILPNRISLAGKYAIKMSDYGLNPPSALWGIVKVNDEIAIDFSFYLERK